MLEKKSLSYKDIFEILHKIIIERDFGEIIAFESVLRGNDIFLGENELYNTNELELIQLCASYIFCVMLKEDEEDIFPFLREYVTKSFVTTYAFMDEEGALNHLEQFYSKQDKDFSIEQRYFFYLAGRGFRAFDSTIGLDNMDEFTHENINKLLKKAFLTNYTRFTSVMIQGLFLLYKYHDNINFKLDPSGKLFFDILLRRIADSLLSQGCEQVDNEDRNSSQMDEIFSKIDKMNLID